MAWPIAAIVTRVAPPDMFAMQLGVRVSFAGTESDAKQQRLRRWKYMFSSINNKTTIKRKCLISFHSMQRIHIVDPCSTEAHLLMKDTEFF